MDVLGWLTDCSVAFGLRKRNKKIKLGERTDPFGVAPLRCVMLLTLGIMSIRGFTLPLAVLAVVLALAAAADGDDASSRKQPYCIFGSHHKAGSVLMHGLASTLNDLHNGANQNGTNNTLEGRRPRRVVRPYHLITADKLPALEAVPVVHFVRDPMQMALSAYFYHLVTGELWCHTPYWLDWFSKHRGIVRDDRDRIRDAIAAACAHRPPEPRPLTGEDVALLQTETNSSNSTAATATETTTGSNRTNPAPVDVPLGCMRNASYQSILRVLPVTSGLDLEVQRSLTGTWSVSEMVRVHKGLQLQGRQAATKKNANVAIDQCNNRDNDGGDGGDNNDGGNGGSSSNYAAAPPSFDAGCAGDGGGVLTVQLEAVGSDYNGTVLKLLAFVAASTEGLGAVVGTATGRDAALDALQIHDAKSKHFVGRANHVLERRPNAAQIMQLRAVLLKELQQKCGQTSSPVAYAYAGDDTRALYRLLQDARVAMGYN